ncbi:MAG TPA: hypothetical protein VJ997_10810 [Longimicrobiales bacterium]|nr:hypothetical protein [Longimicrobiales bacterium]
MWSQALPPAAPQARSLADLTATPEDVATLFLRSVRAIRWSAATQFISDSTLARFHHVVTLLSETDTTGRTLRYLSDADGTPFKDLPTPEVFDRAVGKTIDDMPGLMHSLYDHDDDVIGHVSEGDDRAFVVYRTVERLGGAVPEVRVIETVRSSSGWRVEWSDELDVLETALRGIPRTRRPPAPPRRP